MRQIEISIVDLRRAMNDNSSTAVTLVDGNTIHISGKRPDCDGGYFLYTEWMRRDWDIHVPKQVALSSDETGTVELTMSPA